MNDDWKPDVVGEGNFVVACWAESFDSFHLFKTHQEAVAFADGWMAAADEYGAGKCMAVPLGPKTLADLRRESAADHGEIREMGRRVNDKLPRGWDEENT